MSRVDSSATRDFFLKQLEFIFNRASTACLALSGRTMSLTHNQECKLLLCQLNVGFMVNSGVARVSFLRPDRVDTVVKFMLSFSLYIFLDSVLVFNCTPIIALLNTSFNI